MKTLKYGILIAAVISGGGELAQAKNVSQLKLHCQGEYQVIEAKPFFVPAPTYPSRAILIDMAGVDEQIKVVKLEGSDCAKLKPSYGIELHVGMTLPSGQSVNPATMEAAEDFAQKEVGK